MNEENKWQINGYIGLLLIALLAAVAVYLLVQYRKTRTYRRVRRRRTTETCWTTD